MNRPVSRDDSGFEGGSRPRTGRAMPCATAAAAPGTVSTSLVSPATWASVASPPDTPPSGTCLTSTSVSPTSTALRSPERSAASAAAALGCGTATVLTPASRPASAMMPVVVAALPPT